MRKDNLIDFCKDATICFFKNTLLLMAFMLLVRFFFAIEVFLRLNVNLTEAMIVMSGYVYDILIMCIISTYIYIPFVLLHIYSKKTANIIFNIINFLYVFVYALLTEYFCNMSFPLDSVLFVYSLKENIDIVFSSVDFSVTPFLFIIFIAISSILIYVSWKKIKFISRKNETLSICFVLLFLIVGILPSCRSFVTENKLYSEINKIYYSTNQLSYSYDSIRKYLSNKKNNKEISELEWDIAMEKYQSLYPDFNYIDKDYVLLREKTDADVLGEMLYKTSNDSLPNIVFVIIEGLGQKLTGVDNPSVSFTPFIDSLKREGLYWENCVSSAQRTFGAFPSIMASAPYGDIGFASKWATIPRHNSLIKDMVSNGYKASFFYSGDPSFDGQDAFMKANGVSYILDKTPDDNYITAEELRWKRWGLDDEFMYAMALNHKEQDVSEPFLDMYITISSHEPYIIPQPEKYIEVIDNILLNHKFEDNKEKNNIKSAKNMYASYLYADDCLRDLINGYKQLNKFNNTIFIICGDHGNPSNVITNPLDKYNVPFIIYSPLVKQHKTMKGVITHLDVYPTIDAYLKNNYQYNSSKYTHSLGISFDTSSVFNCNRDIAFMSVNRSITDYLSGNYFISENKLYKVKDMLCADGIVDNEMRGEMLDRLDVIKKMHHYTVNNNLVWNEADPEYETIYERNTNLDEEHRKSVKHIKNKDGNSFVHLSEDVLYSDLCEPFNIADTSSLIMTEIRFNYQCLNDSIPPKLVITFEKDDWKLGTQVDVPKQENNKWSKFVYYREHYIDNDISDMKMKVFLWNINKSEFNYDDISVCIKRK